MTGTQRRRARAITGLVLVVAMAGVAAAAAQPPAGGGSGVVEGRVVDAANGSPLPGATVIATGTAYLRLAGPTYGFFGLGLALYFAAQGAGRLAWPLSAGFLRMTVAIGGGFIAWRLTGSLTWLFAVGRERAAARAAKGPRAEQRGELALSGREATICA